MRSFPAPRERCGACGARLVVNRDGFVSCAGPCEIPMYGSHVGFVLRGGGRVACTVCGFEGVPTFVRGRARLECPGCDGIGDEAYPAPPPGKVWRVRLRRVPVAGISRNGPCSCGSGLKAKKCHPERC